MAIRTAVLREGTVEYFVGGGIVAESDPGREVEETRWKAAHSRPSVGKLAASRGFVYRRCLRMSVVERVRSAITAELQRLAARRCARRARRRGPRQGDRVDRRTSEASRAR